MKLKLKRMLALGLCLLLLCPCAMAAGDRSFLRDEAYFAGHSGYPAGGCAIGDALYLYTDSQIYAWREGDEAPAALNYELGGDGEGETRRLRRLFADGDRLMALIGTYGFEGGEYAGLTALSPPRFPSTAKAPPSARPCKSTRAN